MVGFKGSLASLAVRGIAVVSGLALILAATIEAAQPATKGSTVKKPVTTTKPAVKPSVVKPTPAATKPAENDATVAAAPKAIPEKVYSTGYNGSYVDLIAYINKEIRQGWVDNGVVPSAVADDSEWLRRVSLDIVGHTADVDQLEKFLADKSPDKRAKMIDQLLEDPGYVRNQTTIWTNLLIGRQTPRRVSRSGLQKFLRQAFGKNESWNKVVYELVTAEGHFEENGATNFLMSHLNDGAVPATAITAKLFLGIQVQCTQCHNHPFNDWKQDQFWEFNSFFKQARKIEHQKYNPKTGRRDFDYAELVSQNFEGPVYYERRNGLMQVAFPRFDGKEVDPGNETNRRLELGKLMTAGEKPLIADAMVNRMWGHFMGVGFTRPVDDMGPHNPASHPALLEKLSREFARSGYDLKQLVRWVCNSEAYNLTSKFNDSNLNDNPSAGETPLFSHLYLKSMTGEQLFDSLVVATNAHKAGRSSWEQAEDQRQRWMQQFVRAFGTDENDESTSFDGTIPQALMMMNGDLMQSALSDSKGGLLSQVLTDNKLSTFDKVKRLYMATVGRIPSKNEFDRANRVLLKAKSATEAYQDLYWALLNSNEFIFNH